MDFINRLVVFHKYDKKLDRRVGTAGGLDFIIQVMRVFKASRLEDIKGKMCYALYDKDGINQKAKRKGGTQIMNESLYDDLVYLLKNDPKIRKLSSRFCKRKQ